MICNGCGENVDSKLIVCSTCGAPVGYDGQRLERSAEARDTEAGGRQRWRTYPAAPRPRAPATPPAPPPAGSCRVCGELPARSVAVYDIARFLLGHQLGAAKGYLCQRHVREAAVKLSLRSLWPGWFFRPWTFFAPLVIIHNLLVYLQVFRGIKPDGVSKREFEWWE